MGLDVFEIDTTYWANGDHDVTPQQAAYGDVAPSDGLMESYGRKYTRL